MHHSDLPRSTRLFVAGCLALCSIASGASEVYRWKDANGVTHYSDSRPRDQQAEAVELRDSKGLDGGDAVARPAPAAPRPAAAVQPSILMYDHPDCGYCRRAERWFNQRGLAFRKIDITANAANKAAFVRDGGRGTPLIFVDGVAVRGFNEARLWQLIP